MKTLRVLLYSVIMGITSSQAIAGDNHISTQESSIKRPATDDECDPSNWSSNPDIDYSVCEESRFRKN